MRHGNVDVNEVNTMNCSDFKNDVDALAAGEVSEATERTLRDHAASCDDCAMALATAQYIAEQLAGDRAPEPDSEFETRILNQATGRTKKSGHSPVWGGAIAAALAVGVFIGSQFSSAPPAGTEVADNTPPATTEIASPQQQTVRVAFSSAQAVENVTLTLELPPNMELAPFPGRHKVSWKVNLKPGDNLLALPVNVLFPGEGTLVAHLGDGEKRKTFKTDIGKLMEPSS
ncbi:zf-HC2 domain-containing protein [Marinobacter alexandrii]|uniref:anti-sigma factor family protein n=1 Tax=Marinobacter alexandrii TaxID=2570351 RepID=UPI001FFF10A4|nr:zf-HC2 domain-containing protein [Marinobacter alexandrii]MCK2148272.1 zf-HC2 domain-containing protein [Marinobacter alexandrii]